MKFDDIIIGRTYHLVNLLSRPPIMAKGVVLSKDPGMGTARIDVNGEDWYVFREEIYETAIQAKERLIESSTEALKEMGWEIIDTESELIKMRREKKMLAKFLRKLEETR